MYSLKITPLNRHTDTHTQRNGTWIFCLYWIMCPMSNLTYKERIQNSINYNRVGFFALCFHLAYAVDVL